MRTYVFAPLGRSSIGCARSLLPARHDQLTRLTDRSNMNLHLD